MNLSDRIIALSTFWILGIERKYTGGLSRLWSGSPSGIGVGKQKDIAENYFTVMYFPPQTTASVMSLYYYSVQTDRFRVISHVD